MKRQITIDRLEVLAKFFDTFDETHQPYEFDMSFWTFTTFTKYNTDICKTSYCMAGWAGMIPEFQELGLITNVKLNPVVRIKGWDYTCTYNSEDHNYSCEDAMMHFFELSANEVDNLFIYNNCRTGTEAAKSIRDLIDQIKAEELDEIITSL